MKRLRTSRFIETQRVRVFCEFLRRKITRGFPATIKQLLILEISPQSSDDYQIEIDGFGRGYQNDVR
jgi:hypothetical protein